MKLKFAIAIGMFIGVYISYRVFWIYNPDIAYEWITGNALPKGVVAVSYALMFNDNYMHSGHYWEFTHVEAGMLKLLEQLGVGKEFENYEHVTNFQQYDAIWTLPSIEKALGKSIPKEDIGKGYEIRRNAGHDSWLLISKTGDRSYYELN